MNALSWFRDRVYLATSCRAVALADLPIDKGGCLLGGNPSYFDNETKVGRELYQINLMAAIPIIQCFYDDREHQLV